MKNFFRFAFLISSIGSILACTVDVSDKNRYEGGGVVFEIPMGTSEAITAPGGIDYKGPHFNAVTDGSSLRVNGQDYGQLRAGDVVDFYAYPEVMVNGQVRKPTGT